MIGRDRDAIGKAQPVGHHARRAIKRDQNDAAHRAAIGGRRQIKSEIADIAAPQPVDDHVVNGAGGDGGKIGIKRQLAVHIFHQPFLEHSQHDHAAIRQNAETAWRVVGKYRVLPAIAGRAQAQQRPGHAVDEPEPAGVPARALEITTAVVHGPQPARRRHRRCLNTDRARSTAAETR